MIKQDPSDMYGMITNYPKQFEVGFKLAEDVLIPIKQINNIVIAGMGGSALPADLVCEFFKDQINLPITIHRDYNLPPHVNSKTLFIVISFSGNTEETLSTLESAYKNKAGIIAISSGGELEHRARELAVPYIFLKKESENFQSRMASGYLIGIITRILISAQILDSSCKEDVLFAAKSLDKLYFPPQAKILAGSIRGQLPLIYTSNKYWPIARIGKIKFNENAKVPCFWNTLPEMNHNEMVGFTNIGKVNYHALIFRDLEDNPKINQRIVALKDVLVSQGIAVTILDMQGSNYIEKTLSSLMFLDWISYYLALEMGIDPTPVALVESFKSLLK